MLYQIVTGTYDESGILLFTRGTDDQRHDFKILGERPHMWIPVGTPIPENRNRKYDRDIGWSITRVEPESIPSIDGITKLLKLTTRLPKDVGDLNKHYFGKDYTYESDIVFVRRMLIDSGLTSGIDVPDNTRIINVDNIKPVDISIPPRFILADIETKYRSDGRNPDSKIKECIVNVNCIYDSYTDKYLSIAIDPTGKTKTPSLTNFAPNHEVIKVPNEISLLNFTNKAMKSIDSDIYSCWNVDYDHQYQKDRGKRHKIFLPWKRTNVFDLLMAYKILYSKGSNKLPDVVRNEKLSVPNYQPWSEDIWYSDLDKAILINKSHVEAIKLLNEKYRLIDFYWEQKNLSGFESLQSTLWKGSVVERMLLSRYHGKYILPSRPSDQEIDRRKLLNKESLIGGKVFIPPVGLWEGTAVYDMTRYYLEILISKNLSPEPHSKDKLGVVPKLALELIDARLKYDNLLKTMTPGTPEHDNMKISKQAIKDTTQSIFGYFGHPASRLYNRDIFNEITEPGQKGLIFLQRKVESDGYKFLYGDTDSIVIKIDFDKKFEYEEVLNGYIKEFCKEIGITRELSLKLEKYASKTLFKRKKGTTHGARKRYASRIIFEDGKDVDYINIRGFDYVRREASKVTKKLQYEVIETILRKDPDTVPDIVRGYIKDVLSGKFGIEDICMTPTLRKHPESYERPSAWVRGALYSNKWFGTDITEDDTVKFVYIKSIKDYPHTDVLSVIDFDSIPTSFVVDLDKMVEKSIKNKVEEILELIGYSWGNTINPNRNLPGV